MVTIEDLREMYIEAAKEYREKAAQDEANGVSTFINYVIPKEWGREFQSKKGERLVNISFPISSENDRKYYNFVIAADKLHSSDREPGMKYFGFPRYKKDTMEAYDIVLQHSEKNSVTGDYDTTTMIVSSAELKGYIEKAKEAEILRNKFVGVQISSKLVRTFEYEGKQLKSVSVPVFDNNENRELFYQIVVNAERVKNTDRENMVYLSLFKNGSDGNPYSFTAKRSVKENDGEYTEVAINVTAEQIIDYFKKSAERFKNSSNEQRSLAEVLEEQEHEFEAVSEDAGENIFMDATPSFNRPHGR